MKNDIYEDISEELDILGSELITVEKKELIELDTVLKQIKACESIKCIEQISHTLTNIHMITILVKITNNKVIYFKRQLEEQALELKRLKQAIKEFENG